ncbi:MAG: glycine cleavage system aminomethyltransferase GcvT [Armatimonadetes bacterium]|nr:glycine cleavage system aminomethyltransferase GcvT [Armatimonadota bacterium]
MEATIARTPLYDVHVAAGGKMVPFAGYEMPVQYGSIIAETQAVRSSAGMFDVSHMARLKFTGDRVLEFLEQITTNDVSKLANMEGQYSLLPNPNGGCVDDIIVYRISPTEFRMVVNASNHAKDVAWIKSQNTFGVTIEDQTDATAMIAVQGPIAADIVANLASDPASFAGLSFFGVCDGVVAGATVFAARSGYTGEDGFELICDAEDAAELWTTLKENGVSECGLGSRDILRVEAGLPLYGHELNDELSPMAAGLGWVISKTKSFVGSGPINQARAEGTPTKLQGIRFESKRFPNIGADVKVGGAVVGQVCSGVYSPTLGCGLAFAFLNSDVKIGTACEVDLRGKDEPATVVSKRFMAKPKA